MEGGVKKMLPASIEFHDELPPVVFPVLPWFHCIIPIVAPGINQSYMPAYASRDDINKRLTLVHTPVAKLFLEEAAAHFANYSNIKNFDQNIFNAISNPPKQAPKTPLEITIHFFYPTLWKRDIDGPEKIVIDALFSHFKHMAPSGQEQNWNDNRITALHVYKELSLADQPRIEIEVRCVPIVSHFHPFISK
jgi:Holliday junction resolvase RusA-like endonuclease